MYISSAFPKATNIPPCTIAILRKGSSMDDMETLRMDVDMLGIPDFDLSQSSLAMHYPTEMLCLHWTDIFGDMFGVNHEDHRA